MCDEFDESINPIISGCPELPKWKTFKGTITQHHTTFGNYNIKTTDKCNELKPEIVIKNERQMVVWNMPICTDREIVAN